MCRSLRCHDSERGAEIPARARREIYPTQQTARGDCDNTERQRYLEQMDSMLDINVPAPHLAAPESKRCLFKLQLAHHVLQTACACIRGWIALCPLQRVYILACFP